MPAYAPPPRLAALLPWVQQAQHALLAAVAFTMPFPLKAGILLNSILTIALLASTLLLFTINPARRQFALVQWWLPLLLAAYVLGLAQAIEWKPSWFEVEKKLSWLVFPLVFSLSPPSRRSIAEAARWFVCSMLFVLSMAVLCALVLYYRDADLSHFMGISLLYPVSLHRVYMSLHLLVAALLVLAWPRRGIVKWALFTLLIGVQLLLASRTSLLTTAILGAVAVVWLAVNHRKGLALGITLAILAACAVLSQVSYVRHQMAALSMGDVQPATELQNSDGVPIRRVLWLSAWELIEARPVLGYGTGNDRVLLPLKYREKGLEMAAKDKYNAHNQYLQTWFETGISGLLILLAFLATFIYMSRQQAHWLSAAIGLAFALALVSECMLNAQKGSVFIAFVSACLFGIRSPRFAAKQEI